MHLSSDKRRVRGSRGVLWDEIRKNTLVLKGKWWISFDAENVGITTISDLDLLLDSSLAGILLVKDDYG